MTSLIPLEEARAFVLAHCQLLGTQELAPSMAVGHVTSSAIVSPEPLPPFANSAMDGYALRAEDTDGAPVHLRVIGALMAGQSPSGHAVARGQALRIMTGAALPEGADAVCMVEQTHPDDEGSVVIEHPLTSGTNVRPAGDDVVRGAEVASSGTEITPAYVGLFTALGIEVIQVFRRPRVGVLSTGDELSDGPGPLALGKIRDANRPSLLALLRQADFDAVDLGTVGDDPGLLAQVLETAAGNCDVIVTSGGVSVGDRDVVKPVLEKLSNGTMRWMQVAIKPAKPFAFGILGHSRVPVFGLPGNPVSAMVSFELFTRPALRLMAGHPKLDRPVLRGVTRAALGRRRDGKLHFVRVSARAGPDGILSVQPAEGQGSHQLRTMAEANALALLPDGAGLEKGEGVDVLLLDTATIASETDSPSWPR